ncbi:hypothetical protein WN943_001487 [Citrus x changshan-huyou]
MAGILTYPERVSDHNIEKLRQCVRNGPDKYPGANIGQISRWYSEARLETHHHPHMEKASFARIMPWRTLGCNESVCNQYNADFDGDERNMHVPQTEEGRTEAPLLMGDLSQQPTSMSLYIEATSYIEVAGPPPDLAGPRWTTARRPPDLAERSPDLRH